MSMTPTPTARGRRPRGAKITSEPTTVDYGAEWWSDRGYEAEDLEGHRWHFAQRVREQP
jgi:uncharacterized glyoxalase superfamily protein PhnB